MNILVEVGFDDHVSYYNLTVDQFKSVLKSSPEQHHELIVDTYGEFVGDEDDMGMGRGDLFYDMVDDGFWNDFGLNEWKAFAKENSF